MAGKFYVTTPIYYPNASLHMGHAYTTTLCDVLARHHRIIGDETYFLSGTDDHAIKVAKEAKRLGKNPREFVLEKGEDFKKLYKVLNISNNDFIQTSDEKRHFAGAQEVWKRLVKRGDIYKGSYSGLYCVGCEAFKKKDELVDEKCPLHDQKPEEVEEENYFFKLSKYEKQLKEIIESDNLKITPETRKREVLSLIENGLEDVSFSRPKKSIDWGIPVPGDESQTMYVWCDALTNYITALGFGTEAGQNFEKFWPADVHVVGKDIIRFHAAIWPAMLLSAGIELPKEIFVHGFITSGGKKMSKTIGNVVNPIDIVNDYGVDALRYYLTREVSPFEDGDFTVGHFKEVYNANLANGLGNLVARITKMAETNLSSVPDISDNKMSKEYYDFLDRYDFKGAMDYIFAEVGALDSLIQETKPFSLIKTDKDSALKIIEELIQRLYHIGQMLNPFMPDTSEKIKLAVKENKKPETLFERKL